MKKFLSTTILLLASSAGGLALALPKDIINLPPASVLEVVNNRVAFLSTRSPIDVVPRGGKSAEDSSSGTTEAENAEAEVTETEKTSEGGVNAALVPDFGVTANTSPGARQEGSCDGFVAATNTVVNIPCTCPPSRADFLATLDANVAAGSVQGTEIQFSNDASDQSAETNRLRATAMLVTLQNLSGAGQGCPAASAPNFAIQQSTGEFSAEVFVG